MLIDLNNRPFKKLPGCRRSAFERIDAPALKPLPATPFAISRGKAAKVQLRRLRLDGMVRAIEEQAASTAAAELGFDERLWLACALAHQVARSGFSVLYVPAARLFDELQVAHGDGG